MSRSRARIMLHVQHLLGSGHTRRMAAIARALDAAGAEVLMASGGMPLDGLDTGDATLLQLPPVRSADASYTLLLDADGEPIDDAWRHRRAACLLKAAAQFAPHLLLVETFPFGRRMLRFELLPLIEALRTRRPRARVHVSVRDIIEPPRKAGRAEQTVALLDSLFDGVLVHSDPRLVTLPMSFPLAADIGVPVRYTGYVVDEHATGSGDDGAGEVLVSAGGGPVGAALLECALEAHALSKAEVTRWRVLLAPGLPPALGERLRAGAPDGVLVEPNRRDFRSLLARCRVSVSQAGYNTLLEALVAGARVVAVPYAEAAEREQSLRAEIFAAAGMLRTISPARLSADTLARAIDAAALDTTRAPPIDTDGAATSARLLLADLADGASTR